MLAAITGWLTSKGAAVLLGFLANVIKTSVDGWLASKAQTDLGRITAERDQAIAAQNATQAELQAQIDAPHDADEAIKRLEAGSA